MIRRAEDREEFPRDGALDRPQGARVARRHRARRRPRGPARSRSSCARLSRSAVTAAGSPARAPSCSDLLTKALAESPVGQVLRRGEPDRLGRVRARGDPRPRGQRRDRLLDREPRPDGRPHRRLGHRRAADDALGRGVPGAARRVRGRDPRGRRRVRRLEHPVRAQSRERRRARDRAESARLALVGARVEGDRLPDREGRGQAGRRLHARRDPERPDRDDARELRADARLRRRQGAALRVREVPRRRHDARHADEVRRRGDGHRAHVLRGPAEGAPLARARRLRGLAVGRARRAAAMVCTPGSGPRSSGCGCQN